ncbi:MAG: GTP-binding protein [Ruminococcaceae bacterium]|nr:GTP-binding protein [Oscillospiraceae bacterium]
MKKLVAGILAHVDAGKTTLTEALLYVSGTLRKLGRVDHKDAFLDTDVQERERGITIFSKQAMLETENLRMTLLDTPGHADFSAEMERTLQVLDCAILVISGTDGVQGHTRTLWRLLEQYNVPVYIFINKMDLDGADRSSLMSELQRSLSGGCVDFEADDRYETIAMCDEDALEEYLETERLSTERVANLIAERKVFPCWFGSALRVNGVEEFLKGIEKYSIQPEYPSQFGARVFKISRDNKNVRLTWLKVTGGTLKTKMLLSGGEGDNKWEEKAEQLRLYSSVKFQPLDEAAAGSVVAVTGLTRTFTGMGFGIEKGETDFLLEPVLNYRMILPDGAEPYTVLPKLRQLEEEDPLLKIIWNEALNEIHVRLMGQVQLEVLKRLIADRFDLEVEFGTGNIVYKETISNTVEGVGHFEPLRHYAEVHLLMEPGERGSGLVFASQCSLDHLDLNWQRLILTHLMERDHPGVLTGSAITDMKITLVAGRAHLKHTEGGDFRQATYRAVRQGLMQAESVLLEPFYDFRLDIPQGSIGRAMTDLQTMGAELDAPDSEGDMAVLTGYAPVIGMQDYWQEVASYTRGLGRLSCSFRGYEVCKNPGDVMEAFGYDPLRDADNPSDSVFCSHGAGVNIRWDKVHEYMHVDSGLRLNEPEKTVNEPSQPRRSGYRGTAAEDKELQAIFESVYGKQERQAFRPTPKPARTELSEKYHIKDQKQVPEYLLVDGYNIIFAWDDLKELAQYELAAARDALEDILINYQAYKKCAVILVFDAYKVKGNPGSVEKRDGIHIVYTKEAEIADVYIERTTMQLSREGRVRVATSDNLEQVIILGHGAFRISADAFRAEVEDAKIQLGNLIEEYNRRYSDSSRIKNTANIINGKR